MMTKRNVWLLSLLSISSCAHGSGAAATPREAAAEPAATPAPEAPAARPTAGEEPPPIAADSIESFMLEHYVISTWARDSIVDGNIEAVRGPLQALAEYSYSSVAPGGWMKGIAEMQAAARLTAQAQTLGAAASGIAALGRSCGQCHREHGGPVLQHYPVEDRAATSDQLEVRMLRHAWAMERLWEGLTAPSDNAWMAGATTLARAPATAPKSDQELTPAVLEALDLVRTLGARATRADSPEAREKAYGELLMTCAECHRG